MSKAVRRKLTIEIVFDSREDVVKLLDKIHIKNINELAPIKIHLNNSYMQAETIFLKPVVEPRIEFINGNKCLVFPSSMNNTF